MQVRSLIAFIGLVPLAVACSQSPPPVDTASNTPVAPVVSPPAPPKPAVESLTIDFPLASAQLSPTAQQQLDGAARLYRDAKPEVMIVSGHTDTVGGEFQNLVLSAKRAEAVKYALVDRGVPAERLQVVAVGEAQPTPDITPGRLAVVTWR